MVFIDASSNEQITVGVTIDGKKHLLQGVHGKQKAQVILPLLETLLQQHQLTLQDMSSIEVVEGPGSFTGLRVGIAIANALAFTLGVPINNKPVGVFVEPKYQ